MLAVMLSEPTARLLVASVAVPLLGVADPIELPLL
jgi:hypothetical protein